MSIKIQAINERDDNESIRAFAEIQSLLLTAMIKYVKEAVRGLRRQTLVEKWQVGRELVFFIISCIAGALDSGALNGNNKPRSIIRRSLDRLRQKSLPVDPMHSIPRDAHQTRIPESSPYYLDPLTESDKEASTRRTTRNCQLTAQILNYTLGDEHWEQRTQKDPEKDIWFHFLPLIHVALVFFLGVLRTEDRSLHQFLGFLDWRLLCAFANRLASLHNIDTPEVRKPEPLVMERGQPTWEELQMDGSIFAAHYIPPKGAAYASVDIDERDIEPSSMDLWRKQKILWVLHQMARVSVNFEDL